MGRLLSPSFWVQTIVSVLFTMLVMWVIKKASQKVNVPVVSDIINEV